MKADDCPLLNWQASARVVPFPSIRRRAMIRRAAIRAATSKNPENIINATIERTRIAHIKKGISPAESLNDLCELENALRYEIANHRSQWGVAR